jgi:hypothetical protein
MSEECFEGTLSDRSCDLSSVCSGGEQFVHRRGSAVADCWSNPVPVHLRHHANVFMADLVCEFFEADPGVAGMFARFPCREGCTKDATGCLRESIATAERHKSWSNAVELRRIELLTSSMPWKRSTN